MISERTQNQAFFNNAGWLQTLNLPSLPHVSTCCEVLVFVTCYKNRNHNTGEYAERIRNH